MQLLKIPVCRFSCEPVSHFLGKPAVGILGYKVNWGSCSKKPCSRVVANTCNPSSGERGFHLLCFACSIYWGGVVLLYTLNILRVGVFGLHVFLCTTYVPGALRGQKKMSDPLKLELQLVVKYYSAQC